MWQMYILLKTINLDEESIFKPGSRRRDGCI